MKVLIKLFQKFVWAGDIAGRLRRGEIFKRRFLLYERLLRKNGNIFGENVSMRCKMISLLKYTSCIAIFLWAFGVKEKADKQIALTIFCELSGCKLNIFTLNYAHLNPLPAFLWCDRRKEKLSKRKRRLGNSATAVAASARALEQRDLLKKVDQNFKRQRHHAPTNPCLFKFFIYCLNRLCSRGGVNSKSA